MWRETFDESRGAAGHEPPRRGRAVLSPSYGPDHPNTAIVRNNLAELEAALGKGA